MQITYVTKELCPEYVTENKQSIKMWAKDLTKEDMYGREISIR